MKNDYLNKHLLDFLRIWKKSVESDKPDPRYTKNGLCLNFFNYVVELNLMNHNLRTFEFLTREYFDSHYLPFNGEQDNSYSDEVVFRKIHLNPKRVAWVNKTIIELEKNNVR